MVKNGKYFIYTYGCQMNVHESEKIAGILFDKGYEHTNKVEEADVVVFNTCCIRESAEQRILGNIGAMKPIKAKNKNMIIAVCGCMTQQKNVEQNLKKKFPFINIVFGTNNIEYFGEYLDMYLKQKKYQAKIIENETYLQNPEFKTFVRDNPFNAYVNIMFGCNNFCTYCIVPFVRGREKSRPKQEIINEVKNLLSVGKYKTITLLGQNVNSYGNDFEDKSLNFAGLLKELAQIEGDFELKFMTSHPKDLSDELIDVIAEYPKISHAIHLPVQSGSNKILKMMNRNYTREHYLQLVEKIYNKIPDATLTTDIIVGFPGETDDDFAETESLIKRVKYSNAYIFMYSKRKGTVAEKMENQVPITVKRERINKLLAIQKNISNQHFKELIGTKQKVLIEGENQNYYISKTQCGKVAMIKKVENDFLNIGEFYTVNIVDYIGGNLYAKI